MKKKLFAILFAVFSVSVFAQKVELRNGGMEEWKNNAAMPVRWGAYYNDIEAGLYSQSKDAHSGKYALQIDFEPQREHDNRRFFSFPVKLEEGKYSLTLYMKGRGEVRFVSFTKKDEAASSHTNDVNVVGTPKIEVINNKKWEEYTLDFDIKETDIYQLFICLNAADKLLIDDITLTKK